MGSSAVFQPLHNPSFSITHTFAASELDLLLHVIWFSFVMEGRHYWSVSFPWNIPTILSRSSVLTEYGASWTISTLASDRMISACVMSYQRWPVQLCWSGIPGNVWLFRPMIASSFTLNIISENTNVFTVHSHLSACFVTHKRECNVLQMCQIFKSAQKMVKTRDALILKFYND